MSALTSGFCFLVSVFLMSAVMLGMGTRRCASSAVMVVGSPHTFLQRSLNRRL